MAREAVAEAVPGVGKGKKPATRYRAIEFITLEPENLE